MLQRKFDTWKTASTKQLEQETLRQTNTASLTGGNRNRLVRRDSVSDRIEQSLQHHIENNLPLNGGTLEDKLFEHLNEQGILPLTKVLLTLNYFKKIGKISIEQQGVLKSKALEEDQLNPDGIVSAAVELLSVDYDLGECLDTFEKVLQMLAH